VAEAVPPSGFDNNSKFPRGVRLANNPMLRSGLALTGAQRTIEAWTRGEAVASENDGIVTAEEIGLLNLRGTRLVVLSAWQHRIGRGPLRRRGSRTASRFYASRRAESVNDALAH
jgi:hypothetical protein